jgi:hypothetical protein
MATYPHWRQGAHGPELEGGVVCKTRTLRGCEKQKGCYIRRAYVREDGDLVRAACVKGKHSEGKDERKGRPLNVEEIVTLPELVAVMTVQMRYPNLRISASKLYQLQKFAEVEPVPYSFAKNGCPKSLKREIDMEELSDEEQDEVVEAVQDYNRLVVNKEGHVCLPK